MKVFNLLYSILSVWAEIYTMVALVYVHRVFRGLNSKSVSLWAEFLRGEIRSAAQGVVIGNSIDIREIWRTFTDSIFYPRGEFDTVTEGRRANSESLTDV